MTQHTVRTAQTENELKFLDWNKYRVTSISKNVFLNQFQLRFIWLSFPTPIPQHGESSSKQASTMARTKPTVNLYNITDGETVHQVSSLLCYGEHHLLFIPNISFSSAQYSWLVDAFQRPRRVISSACPYWMLQVSPIFPFRIGLFRRINTETVNSNPLSFFPPVRTSSSWSTVTMARSLHPPVWHLHTFRFYKLHLFI